MKTAFIALILATLGACTQTATTYSTRCADMGFTGEQAPECALRLAEADKAAQGRALQGLLQ